MLALIALYSLHNGDDIYTIEWKDHVHGMFGVHRIDSDIGSPWFLSSERLIDSNKRMFVKESKRWLRRLSADYKLFENFILAENEVHVRWIVHMGFKLVEYREHYGAAKVPFWRFQMRLDR